jgi:hypothetical protein
MDLDRLTAALLYSGVFGVSCGVGGFFFGGLARAFAHFRGRTSDTDSPQAFLFGALRGGFFGAVLGAVLGGLAGAFQMLDLVGAIAAAALLPFLAGLAIVFGLLAYFLEWLGTSSKLELPPDHDALHADLTQSRRQSRLLRDIRW